MEDFAVDEDDEVATSEVVALDEDEGMISSAKKDDDEGF
jgi:hypothetical protein